MLKNSLVFICLISLLTGCVNQNQEVTSDQEITVAATSIAVTEILDQLNIPAKQVVGIPQSDSYTVPKKYQKAINKNIIFGGVKMIKVLANDGLQKEAIDKLTSMGFEVVNFHYDKDELGNILRKFDALIIRSATKVTSDVIDIEAGGKLKLIIRAGVGIDNIDVKYANEKGIIVKNTPNASSDSVAELAIAHMFAVARFLGASNYTMRIGEWNKKKYEGIELSGKIFGIIGMGRIGRALATKATALGMKVVYNDIFGKQNNIPYEFLEFDDLLSKSDFISLHVPYDKNKGPVIGKDEIEKMKDGAYLINCARGKVVDEIELLNALNTGKIAGAGIDVFEEEPTKNNELINHPNVSVTPHIGASTKEAQKRIGEEVITTIINYFSSDISSINAKTIESI